MEIHGLILCEASPLMFSAHAVVHVCLSMMVHMKGCMILYNTQCVALMMMMHLFSLLYDYSNLMFSCSKSACVWASFHPDLKKPPHP